MTRLSTPKLSILVNEDDPEPLVVQTLSADMVLAERTARAHKWGSMHRIPDGDARVPVLGGAAPPELMIPPTMTYETFEAEVASIEDVSGRPGRPGRAGGPYPAGSRVRLICQIAVATSTPPSSWWDEDDGVLATVVDILETRSR
jgi:hypothetical protein